MNAMQCQALEDKLHRTLNRINRPTQMTFLFHDFEAIDISLLYLFVCMQVVTLFWHTVSSIS